MYSKYENKGVPVWRSGRNATEQELQGWEKSKGGIPELPEPRAPLGQQPRLRVCRGARKEQKISRRQQDKRLLPALPQDTEIPAVDQGQALEQSWSLEQSCAPAKDTHA